MLSFVFPVCWLSARSTTLPLWVAEIVKANGGGVWAVSKMVHRPQSEWKGWATRDCYEEWTYEGESDRSDETQAEDGGSVQREGGGEISGPKKPAGLEVEWAIPSACGKSRAAGRGLQYQELSLSLQLCMVRSWLAVQQRKWICRETSEDDMRGIQGSLWSTDVYEVVVQCRQMDKGLKNILHSDFFLSQFTVRNAV